MRRKLTWHVLLRAAILVPALFLASSALATPGQGFTSTPVAQGQFDTFSVFNKFVLPSSGKGEHEDAQVWLSSQRTKGLSDGAVLSNGWLPGGTTGWHTHPGHTLIFVTAGAVTQYQADDPSCTPHVYSAGMSFVDHGWRTVDRVRK